MRVGLVVGEFPHPAATVAMRRAIQLLTAGHDVRILAEPPTEPRTEHAAIARHGLLERTRYEVAHERFDIVHACTPSLGLSARERFDADGWLTEVVQVDQSDEFASLWSGGGHCLARNAPTARALRRQGCPRQNVHIVPAPFEFDESRPPRRQPGRPARLLSVARLVKEKKIDTALRALRDAPGVVYDIIGDGPHRRGLEDLAHKLGVRGRARFHGWCSERRVAAMLGATDMFVAPAGCGVALCEAAAAGVPALAGRDASNVVDGDTGLRVPADAVTLGQAMVWLLEDVPNYRRMSVRARMHAAELSAREASGLADAYRG